MAAVVAAYRDQLTIRDCHQRWTPRALFWRSGRRLPRPDAGFTAAQWQGAGAAAVRMGWVPRSPFAPGFAAYARGPEWAQWVAAHPPELDPSADPPPDWAD